MAPLNSLIRMSGPNKVGERVNNDPGNRGVNTARRFRRINIMASTPLLQSQIPGVPCRRGKVRDVYDLDDKLVVVATDRISAFDWVLPNGIPDKGRVLTQLTLFWLEYLKVPNHLLGTDVKQMGPA